MLAGALGAALLMNCGAFQGPRSDNPNEAVPDAMAGETINTETPKRSRQQRRGSAKRNWNGWSRSSDPGDLVYLETLDNLQFATPTSSPHKARTAARYRRPTVVFERLLGKGDFFAYLTTLDDVIASRGGNPLMAGGKVIGAIGVSGGAGSQDDVVSQAGVAALK
jgi:uncharacterized protein GlcG (DUF336 family)